MTGKANDKIVEVGGAQLIVRDPIHQQRNWQRGRWYEGDMLRYIRDNYAGGVYIDGGACIGNHTVYFATFCADRVIAVEPVPRNATHLRDNVALNELSNVTIIEAALGAEPGRGAMRHFGGFHGQWTLEDGDDVDVVTLDALAEQAGERVTLVKLDIEEGELNALKGAERLLTAHRPVLFIELKMQREQLEVSAFLHGYGYEQRHKFNASPTWEFVWVGKG
jgi:FkbM family methyltransferase